MSDFVPWPSVASQESPCCAVVTDVTLEITASTPLHAAASVAGCFRSATTISAPAFRRRSTVSGFDVARVIALTFSPRARRRRAISPPRTPVAPATRIMYVLLGINRTLQDDSGRFGGQIHPRGALRAHPRSGTRRHGHRVSGGRPEARETSCREGPRTGAIGVNRSRPFRT